MEMRAQNLLCWGAAQSVLKVLVMCLRHTHSALGGEIQTHLLTSVYEGRQMRAKGTVHVVCSLDIQASGSTARPVFGLTISTQKKSMSQVTLYDPRRRRTTRQDPRAPARTAISATFRFCRSLRSSRQSLYVT
ncbi:hypothetical protein BDN71DRAFT_965364 [Pleurotus eryngii]|uniref:Uncharacterized protein n=1 Tax=Pleurotus eryngii TaxID=5323 RepID=A0A9P6A8P4_PLEER|nr:hypothetical protein BDN71DRAFT_965364 [Pleurotus eryngii]